MDPSLATRPGRGFLVVKLTGVLDLASVPVVRAGLRQAVEDGARLVVLDFADVPLIDSTGLGMIVWLHKELLQHGGQVHVAAPRPLVRRVLEVTSLDRLVPVHDTVDTAEDALADR